MKTTTVLIANRPRESPVVDDGAEAEAVQGSHERGDEHAGDHHDRVVERKTKGGQYRRHHSQHDHIEREIALRANLGD